MTGLVLLNCKHNNARMRCHYFLLTILLLFINWRIDAFDIFQPMELRKQEDECEMILYTSVHISRRPLLCQREREQTKYPNCEIPFLQ